MSEKNMKLSDYHSLLKKIKEIQMKEEYIPSIEDLKNIAEINLDRYAPFLLWLSFNHPAPLDDTEAEAIRYLIKLRNRAFEIEFDVPEQIEEQKDEVCTDEYE